MNANWGLILGLVAGVLILFGFWVEERDTPITPIKATAVLPNATTTVLVPVLPETKDDPRFKTVTTTLFWVGEDADAENEFISNAPSMWDEDWQEHFGGIDDPACRNGYHPCGFTPKENPFYFALPYSEFDDTGTLKKNITTIPWYTQQPREGESLVKNHWIQIKANGKTCYAQWEDSGPFVYDDVAYVFGGGRPINTKNNGAGLDISPATWTCLGMSDNGPTSWRFVSEAEVPKGPWKEVVTTSQINWH